MKKNKALSTEARPEGGPTRTSDEVSVMDTEQRGRIVPAGPRANFKKG